MIIFFIVKAKLSVFRTYEFLSIQWNQAQLTSEISVFQK